MKPSKTKQYEKEILAVIKKNNIYCVSDIFAFYKGCSPATFYNHDLEKLESIKEAINDNKIVTKQSLKAKWAKSDNATLQIALFKVICTDEERQALNQSHVDITTKGKEISSKPIEVSKLTDEELAAYEKIHSKLNPAASDKSGEM